MKKLLFSLFVASLLVACESDVVPVLGTLSVVVDENNPEVIACSVEVIEGSVADCGFYYGTSKTSVSTGKATKAVGTYAGSVIQGELVGLAPNTTYYIMAYAMNEKGLTNSQIVQVKTAADVPGAGDNQYPNVAP